MIKNTFLQSAFLRLVGWKQPFDQSSFNIDPDLLVSESGRYFQEAHPLLTLENIKAIAPNVSADELPVYQSGRYYYFGEIIKAYHNDYGYQAVRVVVNSTNEEPKFKNDQSYDLETTQWKRIDLFSYWLEGKMKDAINRMANKFNDEVLLENNGRSIVENKTLFEGAGRLADIDITTQGIVGFEFIPKRSRSLNIRISKVGVQMYPNDNVVQGAHHKVELYLFHSSSRTPLKSINVVIPGTQDGSMTGSMWWETTLEIDLPFMSKTTDAGGSWFIVYDTRDLIHSLRPIVKNKDWSKQSCESCDGSSVGFNAISRYLEVYPFVYKDDGGDTLGTDSKLWDISKNIYATYNNYGLNFEISVLCDLTDTMFVHKRQFVNLYMLEFATMMLREMIYNPNARINRNALLAQRAELIYALEGDSESHKKSGLLYDLERAYKAVKVDFKGLDNVCMPCKNNGIKYRTV